MEGRGHSESAVRRQWERIARGASANRKLRSKAVGAGPTSGLPGIRQRSLSTARLIVLLRASARGDCAETVDLKYGRVTPIDR